MTDLKHTALSALRLARLELAGALMGAGWQYADIAKYPPLVEIEKSIAALEADPQSPPLGSRHTIAHDGFEGTVIGYYTTREGKEGVVLQQTGTRVVHVYGKKWLNGD